MSSENTLPFEISARTKGTSSAIFTAIKEGLPVTTATYAIGNHERRQETANHWSEHPELRNNNPLDPATIALALAHKEADCIAAMNAADSAPKPVQVSRYDSGDEKEKRKESQATKLVQLALENRLDLWHDQDRNPWATVPINNHAENWPLSKKEFRLWLARLFYVASGKTPGAQALQDAINTLAGRAIHEGPMRRTHIRIAEHDDAIYMDLCNDAWTAVRITPLDWELCDHAPVAFRRARAMLGLPTPVKGGSLAELRHFINVGSDQDFILIVAWLIGALHPHGPYPVLAINGEHGSAKTSASKMLRALLDPNEADLRSEPRDEHDLVIAANNGWVIGLDNLSRVPPWLSDAICRISTGGGFGTRELYSDRDEVIFSAKRPVILNGIEELATRSDLLDRTIHVTLPTIPENKRRAEKALWKAFQDAMPRLLGALLDAAAMAMRHIDKVELDRLPRMADFARWIVAAEGSPSLRGERIYLPWRSGEFMGAYAGNREAGNELAIEASPVGHAVRSLVEEVPIWSGSASELLKTLTDRLPKKGKIPDQRPDLPDGWPKRANVLSGHLKRLAPNFRATGINIKWERDDTKSRSKVIKLEKGSNTSSASSAASETESTSPETAVSSDDHRTVRTITGRSSDDPTPAESANPDDRNGPDDQLHVHSNSCLAPGDLTDGERVTFQNRAAVIELSGVPRQEAERRALASIKKERGKAG